MSAIRTAKLQLRKSVHQRLLQLSAVDLSSQSQLIQAHVLALPAFQRAQHVSIYLSMDSAEAQTYGLVEQALASGKSVYVPRCRGQQMDMVRITNLQGLTPNAWGIPEPSHSEPAVDPSVLDFILVPGVAFDKSGSRCGHGKGYYDRYLRQAANAVTCAICLSEQLVDHVPISEHDLKPHILVTPQGIVE
ncbi:hypothetical protein IWW39_003863 [Coemansia spiralis]|uniref:5-formyltetrahydrofolate cyclo-ligase n=1 Tax=Coemansia spiralis TaxID=417178 RepID=A0A9W8L374_9FUNG|nr:hypothetical protein IWW39_003863 [Coemansia spiralis]